MSELTENLPELQPGIGAVQFISVLQWSKYCSWLMFSTGIPPRILCDVTIWRFAVNFNFRMIVLAEKSSGANWIRGMSWKPERTEKTKGSSLAQLCEPNHVRPERGLVTLYVDFPRFSSVPPPSIPVSVHFPLYPSSVLHLHKNIRCGYTQRSLALSTRWHRP